MLVSLSDMKIYLGIPLVDTTYDVFLTQQIQTISEAIENYCGRKFESTTYTQLFYKDDYIKRDLPRDTLIMYHFPLISVNSVKSKQLESDVGEDITNYRTHKPTAKITNKDYFDMFCFSEIVEVNYTAGFATIPFVIQNAVYSLVQERYNKKINGVDLNFGSDVQSISIPGTISIAYDYSLNDNERKSAFGAILGKYINTLDFYRSERTLIGKIEDAYL